jgi:hypothetical protein
MLYDLFMLGAGMPATGAILRSGARLTGDMAVDSIAGMRCTSGGPATNGAEGPLHQPTIAQRHAACARAPHLFYGRKLMGLRRAVSVEETTQPPCAMTVRTKAYKT